MEFCDNSDSSEQHNLEHILIKTHGVVMYEPILDMFNVKNTTHYLQVGGGQSVKN
jgi:hypothetical protein